MIDRRALIAILTIFILFTIPVTWHVYCKVRAWDRQERSLDLTEAKSKLIELGKAAARYEDGPSPYDASIRRRRR